MASLEVTVGAGMEVATTDDHWVQCYGTQDGRILATLFKETTAAITRLSKDRYRIKGSDFKTLSVRLMTAGLVYWKVVIGEQSDDRGPIFRLVGLSNSKV